MGFDMYWKNEPEEVRRARELAFERAKARLASLPENEVLFESPYDLHRAMESQGSYFRAADPLMAALREEMERLGMLKLVDVSGRPRTGSTTNNELEWHGGPDTGAVGIPVYKLESNESWVVTPTEIRGALALAEEYPALPDRDWSSPFGKVLSEIPDTHLVHLASPDRQVFASMPMEVWTERWRAWLHFLGGAAKHGGFVVK